MLDNFSVTFEESDQNFPGNTLMCEILNSTVTAEESNLMFESLKELTLSKHVLSKRQKGLK